MQGLVSYDSDEETNNNKSNSANSVSSILPEAPEIVHTQRKKTTKKRKHNTKQIFEKLGIDVNDMKKGKLTSNFFDDENKDQEEEEDNQEEIEKDSKRKKIEMNNDDPDAPLIEQEETIFKERTSNIQESDIAELPEGVVQPAMQENSDFMKKFKSKIAPQEEQRVAIKRVPKPNFVNVASSIAVKKIHKQDILESAQEIAIGGAIINPTKTTLKQLNIENKNQQNEDEFEIDPSAYKDDSEIVEHPQEEDEPDQSLNNQEEILVALDHEPANGAQEFLMQPQEEEEDNIEYTHHYPTSLVEQEQQNNALQQKSLPANLPKHVLDQLNKPGVNIVSVSGVPSEVMNEVQRRKVLIEKYRRSMYQTPTIKPIDYANYDPDKMTKPFSGAGGRMRHHISFMSQDIAGREFELAERQEKAASKKQSWKKYGWA